MPKEVRTEEFSLLLDGRLSPEREARLQARLNADPSLRQSFEHFKNARNLVRASQRLAALPTGFEARLYDQVRQEALRMRAEELVRADQPAMSLWQKVSIAMSGMAAGVAVMLSLNLFSSGTWTGSNTPAHHEGADVSDSLVVGNEAWLREVSNVWMVADAKLRTLEQIHATANAMGTPSIHPAWLEGQLEFSGVDINNRQLLERANSLQRPEIAQIFANLEVAVNRLNSQIGDASRRNDELDLTLLNQVLGPVLNHAREQLKSAPAMDQGRGHFKTIESNLVPEDLAVFLSAQRLKHLNQHQAALNEFQRLLGTFPNSRYAGQARLHLAMLFAEAGEWDLASGIGAAGPSSQPSGDSQPTSQPLGR